MLTQSESFAPQDGDSHPTAGSPGVMSDVHPSYPRDKAAYAWYQHSTGKRINTDAMIVPHLHEQHPQAKVTIVPISYPPVDLFQYASTSGKATVRPIYDEQDPDSNPLEWKAYLPPAKRIPGGGNDNPPVGGAVLTNVKFGRFDYTWQETEDIRLNFLLYAVDERDGAVFSPQIMTQYLVHAPDMGTQAGVDRLLRAAGSWAATLHGEIWVFDGGFWRKNAELWNSIQKANWDNVIMDPKEKLALQRDVDRFFDGHERYSRLKIAWKRGVIYYGPPGNGKTISIKATMNSLYKRPEPIPTLYVKTLTSIFGPEASIGTIFAKARQESPCLLVFEDLDSIVTDKVRSYFLNEVDGLAANDGVMIIGSTNHLDRLDPGLSKRPSRFDRKFLFDKPNFANRLRYVQFWRFKLRDNKEIEFPDDLVVEMAKITDDFSFAYIQEAFVATLLAIASRDDDDEEENGDEDKEESNANEDRDFINEEECEREWSEGEGPDDSDIEADYAHVRSSTHSRNHTRTRVVGRSKSNDNDKQNDNDNAKANDKGKEDFDNLILWVEFKKQVEILRGQI